MSAIYFQISGKLTYESDHMEEGYPGKLTAVVKYFVKGTVSKFSQNPKIDLEELLKSSRVIKQAWFKILSYFEQNFETYQGNRLEIIYQARTTMKTVVNLTNHVYFNLDGHKQWKDLANQTVAIFADKYTPVARVVKLIVFTKFTILLKK